MKFKTLMLTLLFAVSSISVTAGETLNGAGASFPYPVYTAWAHMYHQATSNKVNYQSIGSGGGIRQIKARTVEFGGTDAPLKAEDLNKDGLLQFPAVIGGVVPVVNIEGLENVKIKLPRKTLAKIFLGEIKTWDHPEIVAANPGIEIPKTPKKVEENIAVIHRSDGSGTTAIFTTFLATVYPEWEKKVGKGKSVKWPAGIGGKGNEGVASYVKMIKNSIGYVEFAYAKQNKLNYVLLDNQEGNFVEPSFEAFKEAAAYAKWEQDKGYYLWLVDAPGAGSWPIAGATFIMMAKEKPESNKKVVKFFDWAFNNGDAAAQKLIYVPLPSVLKDNIRDYWKKHNLY